MLTHAQTTAFWKLALASAFSITFLPASPLAAEEGDIPRDERRVELEGAGNMRDMGGIIGAGGKTVAKGKVFRSDSLEKLSRADLQKLVNLNIATIVDLRSDKEANAAPDRYPETGVRVLRLPINLADLNQAFSQPKNAEDTARAMRDVYQEMPNREDARHAFKSFFATISKEENLSVLFHCSAGKDRTGALAALFLSALGVERAAIFRDYTASSQPTELKYQALLAGQPAMLPALRAEVAFLETFFDEIEKRHDSVDRYLEHVLAVDVNALRELYLVDNGGTHSHGLDNP